MQRFLAVLLGLVVVAAGVGYAIIERGHQAELEAADAASAERLETHAQEAAAAARELAQDLVRVLAVSVAEDVASSDMAALEERLADAVQGHRLAGVLVLSPDGTVLSSTDLRFRGRVLDDPATRSAASATEVEIATTSPAPGQVEVVAPLLAGGDRVGFLRAFVQLDGLAEP